MKKIISTGLVFIILLTLSISVFADDLPRNDLAGSVTLTSIRYRWYDNDADEEYSGFFYPDSANTFEFGKLYNCLFSCFTGNPGNTNNHNYFSYFRFQLDWTLTLNKSATIYLPYYLDNSSSIIEYVSFGSLSQYRNSSKDFTINAPFDYQYGYSARFVNTDDGFDIVPNYTVSTAPLSRDITFYCFENVPSGSYNLTISTYDDLDSDTSHITFNFYMSPFVTIPTVYEDFENGNLSFSNAMNDIQNTLNSVINSNATDIQKLVALGVAQNDIERIKQISDVKYNGVVNDFITDADSIIDSYNNGSIDVNTAITDIQMTYFDALSQSVTPEQGVYINTANQIKIAELQLSWQQDYKEELDSVITDEDLSNDEDKLLKLENLYEKENEAIQAFRDFDIETMIALNEWELAVGDYINYRSIFDFFFEGYSDSGSTIITMCVALPFTLIIIGLILGTSSVVFNFVRRDKE